MFATKQFLFPPTKALLSDPSFVDQPLDFYGGQTVNQEFADIGETVNLDFQWPPFLDQVVTDFTETVGKSLTLLFSVIGSFQLFNEPKLLWTLVPTVIDTAYTANFYAYSLAFTGQQVNYAAMVSFLLGLVIVIVSYAVMLTANRRRAS